jgi:hypothetical protein
MVRPIATLERKVQTLLEQNLVALLRRHLDIPILALELARTLEQSYIDTPAQAPGKIAPHRYTLLVHPQTLAKMKNEIPDLESTLSTQITLITKTLGLVLVDTPTVMITIDQNIAQGSVKILTDPVDPTTAATIQMTPLDANDAESTTNTMAYIIVNGDYYHPLRQSLITIGRKLDNNIIIENPDVSRSHAQIRLRVDKWVLFDTSSRLGTQINNKPIKEQVLQNGDVISIGSTTLIFVEDTIDHKPMASDANRYGGTVPI